MDPSKWDTLKERFHQYRTEQITRPELIAAIGMYQRANNIETVDDTIVYLKFAWTDEMIELKRADFR